ncbi:hypothetical protein [Desulfobacter vibrioformis]|uniref:hypothetical protein n=1 Tax=Desulfobacter vibrioformis TaxID=34031 RepID=UPI000558689F|nr:hypothetical protein [Desulfobacter vibrioformis]
MCEKYSIYASAPAFELYDITRSCRFHKKKGERYSWKEMMQDFGCLELFQVFYPAFLAAMYQSDLPETEQVIRCPSAQNSVTIELVEYAPESFFRRGLNLVKQVIRPIRPSDFMLKDIGYRVLSVKGICPCGLSVGEDIRPPFTKGACPAWMYSMLVKKSLAPDAESYRCPSDANFVSFRHETE